MEVINVLYLIIALFFFMLIVKSFLSVRNKEKICAICLAVSLSWISLLVLYYLKKFDNPLILSLLMGMTLLGVFYTLEKSVQKNLTFFRLPFLLTLIVLGYFVLTLESIIRELLMLVVLWIIFGIVYYYRRNRGFKRFVNKVVECCRKW